MTWRHICETIALWINETQNPSVEITGRHIWLMNPQGELWPVLELYELAKAAGYK